MDPRDVDQESMLNRDFVNHTPLTIGYAEPDGAGDELIVSGGGKTRRPRRQAYRPCHNQIIRTFAKLGLPRKPRMLERYTEWQIGIAVSIFIICLVFFLNLGVRVWVWVSLEPVNGIGRLPQDCATIKVKSRWIHLGINLISSIALAISNYCMQRLTAPTRLDIDKAHAVHRWLDVGTPSIRNLWRLGCARMLLWVLIGSSSIPLHLL